jgi:hypothetical protein
MAMCSCRLDPHAQSSNDCVVDRRGRRVTEGEVVTGRRGFGEPADWLEGKSVRLVVEA